jgi:hypothetical protein
MLPSVDPADWIDNAARAHPRRLFLRTPVGRDMDYAGLRDQSARFAAALTRLGIVAGDRVAVQVEKSADAVLLYVACLRMGAVYVPINVASTPNEVDYFLGDTQARIAVIRPADRALLEPLAKRAAVHLETLGLRMATDRLRSWRGGPMPNPIRRSASTRNRSPRSCTRPARREDRRAPCYRARILPPMRPRSPRRGDLPAVTCCCTCCRCSTFTVCLPRSTPCWHRDRVCCYCRTSMPHRRCGCCRKLRCSWASPRITRGCCSTEV